MTQKTPITSVVYEGNVFRVEFYIKLSGEALAETWLESVPESMQTKFAALFAWMGDHGKIANERKFKHLTGTDQIFEFKSEDESFSLTDLEKRAIRRQKMRSDGLKPLRKNLNRGQRNYERKKSQLVR
jgi:hypothetical protein